MSKTWTPDHTYGMGVALQVALRTIIASHPEAEALARRIDDELEFWYAHGLGKSLSEGALEGFQAGRRGIRIGDVRR